MCRRPNTVSSSNSCRKSLKLNNKYFFIEKNYIELTSYLRIKWKNSRMNKLMNYHSYRILLYRSSFFIPPSLLLFSSSLPLSIPLYSFVYQFHCIPLFINSRSLPFLFLRFSFFTRPNIIYRSYLFYFIEIND